jgi:hypothetical protein
LPDLNFRRFSIRFTTRTPTEPFRFSFYVAELFLNVPAGRAIAAELRASRKRTIRGFIGGPTRSVEIAHRGRFAESSCTDANDTATIRMTHKDPRTTQRRNRPRAMFRRMGGSFLSDSQQISPFLIPDSPAQRPRLFARIRNT